MSVYSTAERNEYGVIESNPINDEVKATREAIKYSVSLDSPFLVKITRLRLVSDRGYPMWDVSYCYGETNNGEPVRVHLPRQQFSKRNLKGDIIEMCREAHVYAKGLGILDPSVISICQ